MHELPWITIFWQVRRFGNDFHEWRSQKWKSMPNHLTSDKKIVIHGSKCIILFLKRYSMSWTHKSAKNYHRALIILISPLLPRAVFSDLALWRHQNWSVTSREREILVLWRHIRRLTQKLAQRRSSLLNNSREYQYPATRYSRLSM